MVRQLIAVTMGDPAGIGPELCLRLATDRPVLDRCIPVIFGHAGLLRRVARHTGLPAPELAIAHDRFQSGGVVPDRPAIIDHDCIEPDSVVPGRMQAECGRAAFVCIESAIRAAMSGKVAAVVTAPINKESLNAAGLDFPGHTEIFARETGAERVCMMLSSDDLTVSLVTTHIGLDKVSGMITTERVLDAIELTAAAMARLRGRTPRISVCGLNPHAGEHGLFGNGEEESIIRPAIESARRKGIDALGPFPPDTVFVKSRLAGTDAVVCMYHDQGLIPLKLLAFDMAVNVTLGLPIVRTSPDHGTAFDIAWTGKADPSSMIQAVLLAVRLGSGTAAGQSTGFQDT